MNDNQSILVVPVNDQDHIQGPDTASVTLVEYGDYECPHCGMAFSIIKAVQKKLGPKLRFVFRNFPLSNMHPFAELAAESAEAAGAQGKFWEMHDAIYENQDLLGEEMIEELAKKLKLDINHFNSDIKTRKFKERVRKDFIGGAKSGVNGTPSLFINGERFDESLDEETLIEAISERRPYH
jgi:protein-disulfide isomerase